MIRTKNIFSSSLPSILAILSVETMNVLMFRFSPINSNIILLVVWLLLQTAAGFIFAYFSDKHYRKRILILSQILGVIAGSILYFFNLDFWVIGLIACFNPLPVARAALLDNFPKVSSLRILGFTFIAQYFPWFLFKYITKFPYQNVVLVVLAILCINIFFTLFFFKDNYDIRIEKNKNKIFEKYLLLILAGFIFAEISFYVEWDFLEYQPIYRSWFTPASLGTIFGISIAMIYSRLPHISFITLCYFIGAASIFTALFLCFAPEGDSCKSILVSSMSQFSIIGGLYLPFVADAIIKIVGPRLKAFGSALVELCGVIAALVAWFFTYLVKDAPNVILIMLFIFFLIAAFFQKIAEKHKVFNK